MVSSTPRPHITTGKDPVPIVQEAGWALGPVWTGEKSRPHRDSIPDRPARSQSLYRMSYPAQTMLRGETRNAGEHAIPVPLCLPHIQQGLAWARNWISAVIGQRPTAYIPARSYIVYKYWRCLQALDVDTGVPLVGLREIVFAIQ